MAGLEPNGSYEIVRETFRTVTGGSEEDWKRFLFNGYQEGSAAKPVEVALAGAAVNGALQAAKPAAPTDNLEVVFHAHYCVDDGRYNNNGWLQELPEPITKIGVGEPHPAQSEDLREAGAGEPNRGRRDNAGFAGEGGCWAGERSSARPGCSPAWRTARLAWRSATDGAQRAGGQRCGV